MMAMAEMSTEPRDRERWRKNTTRQAILAAARRLIARDGAEAVTLGRVAAEAGFAAPAVYSYFVTKDELHLAIVTDDLERIADAMRAEGTLPAEPVAEVIAFQRPVRMDEPLQTIPPEAADPVSGQTSDAPSQVSLEAIHDAIGIVLEPDNEPAETAVEPGPDAFPESLEPAAPEKKAVQRWKIDRTARQDRQIAMPFADASPAVQTAQPDPAPAIAKLEEAVARLENRPVDAWLERRLRVFERTLTDLESRIEKSFRPVPPPEAGKGMDPEVAAIFDDLERRAEARDQQLAGAITGLRAQAKDLAERLEALERAKPGASADQSPEPVPADPVRVERTEPAAQSGEFLTAARRAANAAALKIEHPGAQRRPGPAAPRSMWRRPRVMLQIITALLILGTLAVSGLIALRRLAPAEPAAKPIATLAPDARIVALAKAGNPKAELIAGLKLLTGDGVATDVPSAAHWLGLAAAQHEPVAEYWLGTLFERGRGVAKDRVRAMRWYEDAAKAGNAKAMYRLGVGLAEGWRGKADRPAAVHWFEAAAKLGVIDAQFNLAVLYERGDGVAKSLVQAFTWYAVAAGQGDAESKAHIDQLAAQMNAGDLMAAQANASHFAAAEPDARSNREPSVAEVAGRP